jgi:hypothetical protein
MNAEQGLIHGIFTTDIRYFSPKRKFPLHILFYHFDEQKIPLAINFFSMTNWKGLEPKLHDLALSMG